MSATPDWKDVRAVGAAPLKDMRQPSGRLPVPFGAIRIAPPATVIQAVRVDKDIDAPMDGQRTTYTRLSGARPAATDAYDSDPIVLPTMLLPNAQPAS